jgi:sulfite exporter TauE/SafE
LLVAALASSAVSGAVVMAMFALASAPGLLAGSWLARRLLFGRGAQVREIWAARLAGATLLGASAWALGHQLGPQFAAFCRTF